MIKLLSSACVWTKAIGIGARHALSAVAVTAVLVGATIPARADLPPPGLADLVDTLMPAIVNITTRSLIKPSTGGLNASGTPPATSSIPPAERSKTALGSGFVIDPSGIIVTNNHVVEGAFDITVTFQDGTLAHAAVIGTTKVGDIALLKVNLNHKLPVLRFGDSTQMRVGDPVIAIGNPLGFGGSVSTGIVSALNRDIMISPFDDFIQTDAALNHGNSGGPMLNLAGEVIGVNTALYTPTDDGGSIGIGFAIPSFCVQFVVSQLLQYGYVRAGEVGLKLQDVTGDIAHAAGLPPTSRTAGILPGSAGWGVIVTDVTSDGPAAEAGLRQGDILLKVNGDPIGDTRAFARKIAIQPLNQTVPLLVWRDGTSLVVKPTVREWLTGEQTDRAALATTVAQHDRSVDLGLRLAALTPELRSARNIPTDQNGVLITSVMPDSVAGDRGLSQGDVILKVMDTPVTTPDDVLSNLRTMFVDKRSMTLVLVSSRSGLRWVPLPIDAADTSSTDGTENAGAAVRARMDAAVKSQASAIPPTPDAAAQPAAAAAK